MLKTSPSQYQTYWKICPRKWFFRYVCGLEEQKKTAQNFGSAVHKVIERFLRADPQGRDPATGKAVELYPPGWDTEFKLVPSETDLIQRLIREAIEAGVIYRPGGEYAVEHEYFLDLAGGKAQEHGFSDLLEATCVTDHKTTSNSKWSLNKEELKADLQMRCYARVLSDLHVAQGDPPPEEITLRHNIFVWKQNPRVLVREATVTREDLAEHAEKIESIVSGMIELTQVKPNEWEKIENSPRPRLDGSPGDGCQAYGGCPYRSICSKVERPDQYKMRMENLKKSPAELTKESFKVTRSISGLLGKTPVAAAVRIPPALPAPAVVPPIPAEAAAAPAAQAAPANQPPEGYVAPPWYRQGCIACTTNPFPGFDTKGRACRPCDVRASNDGDKTSSDFVVTVSDGVPTWVLGTAPVIEAIQTTALSVESNFSGPDIGANSAKETIEKAFIESQIAETEAAAEVSGEAPKRRGRKPGSKNKPKTAVSVLDESYDNQEAEDEDVSIDVLKTVLDQLANLTILVKTLRSDLAEISLAPTAAPQASFAAEPAEDGFFLAIGSHPRGEYMDLMPWLRNLRQALAKEKGAPSYYTLHAFDRRDWVCAAVERLVPEMAGWVVAPRELDPDTLPVVNLLRGHAKQVIE